MPDKMYIEIEDDGTISVTTDGISGTNHLSAENFIKDMAKLAGGIKTTKKRNKYSYTHVHSNGEVHIH